MVYTITLVTFIILKNQASTIILIVINERTPPSFLVNCPYSVLNESSHSGPLWLQQPVGQRQISLHPHLTSLRKDPGAGKDWGQEEKGMIKDEMVGWRHWLNGHEFEQALGGEGQGSLACCSPWGHKELDTTEQQLTSLAVWNQGHYIPLFLLCFQVLHFAGDNDTSSAGWWGFHELI